MTGAFSGVTEASLRKLSRTLLWWQVRMAMLWIEVNNLWMM